MQITDEITLADIDEALEHLRDKLQDRYGNRLTYNQRQLYLSSVDDLLDARNTLTEGNHENCTEAHSGAIS